MFRPAFEQLNVVLKRVPKNVYDGNEYDLKSSLSTTVEFFGYTETRTRERLCFKNAVSCGEEVA